MVGGDFDIILSDEEKLGGLPVTLDECEDFAFCITSCELFDMGYKGSLFMWWNGRSAGDSIREEVVKVKGAIFEEDPSIVNRIVLQKTQAELKKYLHLEEQYWRQKAGFTWYAEGDRNTSVFHNYVNGRRRNLQLSRIQDGTGSCLGTMDLISQETLNFFQNQFTQEGDSEDFDLLKHVRQMVTHEQNMGICGYPTKEELKNAVFVLSRESASGPDGFTGVFYQHCWDIVGNDVHAIVLAFFDGAELPKSITHTNLVLIPKKHPVQTCLDLRPIRLSNFINKEIVSDIRIRGKPANVIIKLDMAKAYDRVSWKYLLHVLRKMRFAEHLINLIRRLVDNNWALNSLFKDSKFIGYGMPKWTYPMNHLAYVDDSIIFTSADPYSLKCIMYVLNKYEKTSRQLINKGKISYYMHSNVGGGMIQTVGDITSFTKGNFPFIYLGCPITHSRKKKIFYLELIKKVKGKLLSWKGKLLTYGGKVVSIKSVLQSMPIHLLSVLAPPLCVLKDIHRIFAKYFWSNDEERKCRHWAAWQDVCLPTHEGGLGLKSMFDVSNALFAKLRWRFRTTGTMWANYMWNKYFKKLIPTLVHQVTRNWWKLNCAKKLKLILHAVPIWRRLLNLDKHEVPNLRIRNAKNTGYSDIHGLTFYHQQNAMKVIRRIRKKLYLIDQDLATL
ncbi:uncharacterized protein LOC132624210 [Lycium barbarum]|uniref:uncharacterized protein LOC132624210 n=1 Tax=Lycium barbarum TaxID=112863 RepID=UPI00293EE914|nr:uncharacterized protein LOC132624210 [Lycium barbarum]